MPVRLVLRDLVAAALAKQVTPLTTAQLSDMLTPYGCGDPRQIGKALRQLEAQGTAVRDPGRPWNTPDQWRATHSG